LPIHEIARAVFSQLCHQQPERAWLTAGETLPLCARCTGVYVGTALALLTLPLVPRQRPRLLGPLAALAVAQMVVLGGHLVPLVQPPWLRTLSGQIFATALVVLLALPLRGRRQAARADWTRLALASLAAMAALATALAFGSHAVALAIETLALVGVVALAALATVALIATLRRAGWGKAEGAA
jgi:uncharacterized membrane protein